MKRILLNIVILLLPFTANAGHIGAVKLTEVRVFDHLVLMRTDRDIVTPSCALQPDGITPQARYIAMPLSETHASNRKLSVILSAFSQNKTYNPNCYGGCDSTFASWLGQVTICTEARIQ